MNSKLDLFIYTHASPTVGHGHLMRSIALFKAAQDIGLKPGFINCDSYTSELLKQSNLSQFVVDQEGGFAPYIIHDQRDENPPELVQKEVNLGSRVLLMDELGESRKISSVVVDAMMTEARSLVLPKSKQTKYLYGLDYVPLQKQFLKFHNCGRPGKKERRVPLICLGGSDPQGYTKSLVEELNRKDYNGPALIVTNNHTEVINDLISSWDDAKVISNVNDMSKIMVGCDLVITKLGILTLEAFCIGLPVIEINPTPAHVDLSNDLIKGYNDWPAINMGITNLENISKAASKIIDLLQDEKQLKKLGKKGSELVDGKGAERIIEELVNI